MVCLARHCVAQCCSYIAHLLAQAQRQGLDGLLPRGGHCKMPRTRPPPSLVSWYSWYSDTMWFLWRHRRWALRTRGRPRGQECAVVLQRAGPPTRSRTAVHHRKSSSRSRQQEDRGKRLQKIVQRQASSLCALDVPPPTQQQPLCALPQNTVPRVARQGEPRESVLEVATRDKTTPRTARCLTPQQPSCFVDCLRRRVQGVRPRRHPACRGGRGAVHGGAGGVVLTDVLGVLRRGRGMGNIVVSRQRRLGEVQPKTKLGWRVGPEANARPTHVFCEHRCALRGCTSHRQARRRPWPHRLLTFVSARLRCLTRPLVWAENRRDGAMYAHKLSCNHKRASTPCDLKLPDPKTKAPSCEHMRNPKDMMLLHMRGLTHRSVACHPCRQPALREKLPCLATVWHTQSLN